MTTPAAPRTAAGRALLQRLPVPDWRGDGVAWEQRVLAIEAEAAQQERERIRAAGTRTHRVGLGEPVDAYLIPVAILDAAAEGEGQAGEQLWRRHGRYGKFDHDPDTADVAYECEDLGEGCNLHKPGQFAAPPPAPSGLREALERLVDAETMPNADLRAKYAIGPVWKWKAEVIEQARAALAAVDVPQKGDGDAPATEPEP